MFLSDDPLGNFDDLLDLDIQDHVIEVMKEWCTDTHSALNASRADLVEVQISKPLKFWIDEIFKEGAASNHHVIEAANEFAIKADNIAYILRYKTGPLYPEHVALLNVAWSVFQRSMVYGLHIRNRILKEIIANPPDLSAAVDQEIKKRNESEAKNKEARNQAAKFRWQKSGAEAATKYTEADKKEWCKAGKKLLEMSDKSISIRELAQKIQEELNCPYEAIETIRKTNSIINLVKEHSLKK